MIGFRVYYVLTNARLVVVDPVWVWGLVISAVFILFLPVMLPFQSHVIRSWAGRTALWAVIVFAFAVSYQRITLDRKTNTATFDEFKCYNWHSKIIPLNEIDNASVRTSDVTSAIQIQYTDGRARQISVFDQMGGKDEAVFAINNFLGRGHP